MLKKKLLFSLVLFQGILIILGIIAIIFGVFYKIKNSKNSINKMNHNIELNQISLFDENHYQQKAIKDSQAIFQIIDIETNEIKREIIINE
tara:strand:+ start:1615 stop:1887 length:273 start_codon:yes stop_codon:yes gene_type:complete